MKIPNKHLVIVTTVPETLLTILQGQPHFLRDYFKITLVTTGERECEQLASKEGVNSRAVAMERRIAPLRDLRSLIHMSFALLRLRPDIVHSYTPKAGLIAMLAAWITRRPTRIHTFTGLVFPTSTGFKRWLLKSCDKVIAACATTVVPEGQGVRQDLMSHGVTRKPLEIIGAGNIAGVDTDYFSRSNACTDTIEAIQKAANIGPDDFVFCFIGRLNRDKGLLELATAFQSLPSSARLLVVGAEDTSAPVDDAILTQLRNDKRVFFAGFQQDIRPYLAASNVIVLPSYREGFPNVLLQAGSMEIPAIATDINGCNEIVLEGVNGWLVASKNAAQLQDVMLEAMKTPSTALASMGAVSRGRVKTLYDQHSFRAKLVEFYQNQIK